MTQTPEHQQPDEAAPPEPTPETHPELFEPQGEPPPGAGPRPEPEPAPAPPDAPATPKQ